MHASSVNLICSFVLMMSMAFASNPLSDAAATAVESDLDKRLHVFQSCDREMLNKTLVFGKRDASYPDSTSLYTLSVHTENGVENSARERSRVERHKLHFHDQKKTMVGRRLPRTRRVH
ncbi:MAG: hypothetical protein ACK5O7_07425 [Holosporales bacterium]